MKLVSLNKGAVFVSVLGEHRIASGMDGRGCWRDNVFVGRLWRTVKYEQVYPHTYATVSEARAKLAGYFAFYDRRRPHRALDGRTSDDVYFAAATRAGLNRRATT